LASGFGLQGILTIVSDDQVTIRPLETRAEYEACVALQRDIWGRDFMDVVPATILMVSQQVGGVASGAFDAGRLVGFVFGISGVRDRVTAHWSDMLAVRPEARGRGLGRRLKLHQRERLLAVGIERVYWTFDPLVARNARLNLTTLGASPVEYVSNMYGDTGSRLHRGLDTDRFIVEWRLRDPAVERRLAGTPARLPAAAREGPIVTLALAGPAAGAPLDNAAPLPDAPWVRVELPADVARLKADAPDLARRWQQSLRRAFTTYLNARHARVAGVHADPDTGRWFYTVDTTGGDS
jgi:predicted GNAT superfamily acetyltransferase